MSIVVGAKGEKKMARYIDADNIIKSIRVLTNKSQRGELSIKSINELSAAEICGCIFNAPTADVQEVRHGYWYWYEEPHSFYNDSFECGWKCSYCNNYPDHDNYVADDYENKPELKYCNNCGALMDGKE